MSYGDGQAQTNGENIMPAPIIPSKVAQCPETAQFGTPAGLLVDNDGAEYAFAAGDLPAEYPFVLLQVQGADVRIDYSGTSAEDYGEIVAKNSSGRFTREQVLAMSFFPTDASTPTIRAFPYATR
jgi:hypothetical protein